MTEEAGVIAIAQEQPQEPQVAEVPQEAPKEEPSPEPQPKPEDKKPTGYERVKAKNAALQAQLEEAQRKLAETQAAQPKVEAKGKPDPKDYEGKDWSEYYADLAEWTAEQKLDAKLKEREAREKEESLKTEAQKRQRDYEAKVKEFAKTAPDFHDVTEAYDGPFNQTIAQALLESDMGPQIAYHLAKNPEEAEVLDGMSYGQVARYFGKLEAKLEAPKTPTVKTTNAPPPIKPVGGSAKGSYDPFASKGDDYEAYAEWRRQQNM